MLDIRQNTGQRITGPSVAAVTVNNRTCRTVTEIVITVLLQWQLEMGLVIPIPRRICPSLLKSALLFSATSSNNMLYNGFEEEIESDRRQNEQRHQIAQSSLDNLFSPSVKKEPIIRPVNPSPSLPVTLDSSFRDNYKDLRERCRYLGVLDINRQSSRTLEEREPI